MDNYLLTYFEQDNIYRGYNQNVNWSDPANIPYTSIKLKVLGCPATPNAERLDADPGFDASTFTPIAATGDYAGIYRNDPRLVAFNIGVVTGDGIVSKTQKVRFGDISDGLSNTIHIIESAGKPSLFRAGRLVSSPPGFTNGVQGGGWCRPASEIPSSPAPRPTARPSRAQRRSTPPTGKSCRAIRTHTMVPMAPARSTASIPAASTRCSAMDRSDSSNNRSMCEPSARSSHATAAK